MFMEYLTQLIDKTVVDQSGERFGKLVEVVVTPAEPLPVVAAYQVKTEDGAVFVPWDALRVGTEMREFQLTRPITQIQPYMIGEHDFSLVRDVLDKQIVDVHDYRVVRVNDIRLEPLPDGHIVLLGVDPGVRGVVRRLGWEAALGGISRMLHLTPPPENVIAWNDVESLPTHNAGEPLKLRVSHEKLARLHPADIGDILNQMQPAHRREVLETLDIETAAVALAEADEDVQVAALQHLDEERAADILEEMPADEAADVLGDMDKAHREDLLGRMDANDRDNVEELLEYADETAGGLMTNEYVAIPQDISAQDTIETLRSLEPEAETIYYVYVVDHNEHLVGVISLRDLIVSKPDTPVAEFMIRNVLSIHVDARVDEVARKFERYKLLALPVVDDDNQLQGIITIDDTLEKLLPPDWRRRSYHNRRKQHASTAVD
jgi:magnesium transporter